MAEITSAGFVGTNENEYYDQLVALYLSIDPNWNLDPSTPDGLFIAAVAEIFANLDEQAGKSYGDRSPNTAQDTALDIVSAITNTFRDLGTPSNVAIDVTGTAGTFIPSGSQVKSSFDQSIWGVDTSITIGGGGTASGTATAIEDGATEASIGTITDIVTVIAGWATVTNPSVATPGSDAQSDASLRLERKQSVSAPGTGTIDAIKGAIFSVDNVTNVQVLENDTGSPDGNGQPGNSVGIYAIGGSTNDIAVQIYNKRVTGILMWADPDPGVTNEIVNVVSPLYPPSTTSITFNRPEQIDIILNVTIQNDGSLPLGTIVADVTQSILNYAAGGEIPDDCGFNNEGFDIAEDVPERSIDTPVNQVIGTYGRSYITALAITGAVSGVLTINFNQISRWTSGNITVTII